MSCAPSWLDGWSRDDTLTGGHGSDIIVFARTKGADLVTHCFEDTRDDLDLTAFRCAGFATALALARDAAGGLMPDFISVGGSTVVLAGVTKELPNGADALV